MNENPICTVDVVFLTLKDAKLHVALFKRTVEPFGGTMALPGGYIHVEEDDDTFAAAMRVLKAKTGVQPAYLEQLKTYSGVARDPRGWSISVAYYALVDARVIEAGGVEELDFYPVDRLPPLPFDHKTIVLDAVDRVRSKGFYSSLPAHLAGEVFSLPSLQATYEAVMGETTNAQSFRRKVLAENFLEKLDELAEFGRGRAADVYRLKPEFRTQLYITRRPFNS
jgi:8-oxo-dGTP diphosphatase